VKFLVIDNGSQYLENILLRLSAEHEVEVESYRYNKKIRPSIDTDMIILSGGMQNEVLDKVGRKYYFDAEFDLINSTNIPIFGICLGLQMLTVATGGSLRKMPKLVHENKKVHLNHEGHQLLEHGDLFVHERHQWVADNIAGTGFNVLADSSEGIEIIHHRRRNLFATQFHPEIDTQANSEQDFWRLINSFLRKSQEKSMVKL